VCPAFSGILAASSSVFCVVFCRAFLSLCHFFFGHGIVCPSLIYGLWIPCSVFKRFLCLLFVFFRLAIVLSVFLQFTVSDYSSGILWPLCCLSFFNSRFLSTPLVSSSISYVCSLSFLVSAIVLSALRSVDRSINREREREREREGERESTT
jgi:hypothetical protein